MPGLPRVSAKDFFEKRYKFPAKKGFFVPFWVWHHFHTIKIGLSQSLGWFITSKSTDSGRISTNYLCDSVLLYRFTSCQPVAHHNCISNYTICSDKGYKCRVFFCFFVPFFEKLLFLPCRQPSKHETKPKLFSSAAVPI